MALFSERYGYLSPRTVIIREQITEQIQNSIYNWITKVYNENCYSPDFDFRALEHDIWVYFLDQRIDEYKRQNDIIRRYILNEKFVWFRKLDLIEVVYEQLVKMSPKIQIFTEYLNNEFERHNFAYRLVDGRIVEITSEEEIKAVEQALITPIDGVRTHLQTALKHLSASQNEPDYRNSIKESISAVECYCRTIIGENSLGKALNKMEANGITLNTTLKSAFEKLYGYTNNPDTGIRHALIDDTNIPTSAEATYMLVTCSAFINYLNTKNI